MDDNRLTGGGGESRKKRRTQLGGQGAAAPPGTVIDIRGGTVLFEPGAVGGVFTGVYFSSDQVGIEVGGGGSVQPGGASLYCLT